MPTHSSAAATTILLLSSSLFATNAFFSAQAKRVVRSRVRSDEGNAVSLEAQQIFDDVDLLRAPAAAAAKHRVDTSRRRVLATTGSLAVGIFGWMPAPSAAAAKKDKRVEEKEPALPRLLPLVKEARSQLDAVPPLIEWGKWDSVRAILIKPPLSDCWTKGSYPALLQDYAAAVGEEIPDGDELAALEAREEARSHLRFLDMAVYNNVFNPIATEGESGATKELVRSYYEDPKNELKAAVAALDELIRLGLQ